MGNESKESNGSWRLSGYGITTEIKTRKSDLLFGIAIVVFGIIAIFLGTPHFSAEPSKQDFSEAIDTMSKSNEKTIKQHVSKELGRIEKRSDERYDEIKTQLSEIKKDVRELRVAEFNRRKN